MSIRVNVRLSDISDGIAGDCFRCSVALALQRATKDKEARVVESDWQIKLCVHSREITAPSEVVDFVRTFDDLPRLHKDEIGNGKPILPKHLPEELRPFKFTLPDLGSAEWQERCCICDELFATEDLDDEGICQECKE